MVSLPTELLGAIVAEVHSPSDLLQLRATNSTLNKFATPLVFQSVSLANRDKSIKVFKLLATSRLAPLVREVVFQYMEKDPNRKSEPLPAYAPRGFDGTGFVEALGHFAHFNALESLVLNFRQDDGPFKSDYDSDEHERDFPGEIILQFLIFKALADLPFGFLPPLKSLTVDKYLPLPHPSLESRSIIGLLGNLNHLAIRTTTQCAAFPTTNPRIEQVSDSLFKKAIVPASLVSLQLHHACLRSADMLIPLSEVHLPRLERLSLQRTYFSEQADLEGFIARHGATLVELKIFLCPMTLSTSSPSSARPKRFRRWAQVWERLDGDLKVLKNLVVSERHDSKGVEDAGLARYVDNCYRGNAVKLGKAETAEDDDALKRFQKKVESRLPE